MMDYLSKGKTVDDLSSISNQNGNKFNQGFSKKYKKKLSKQKCLDIYNNIQLIDAKSLDELDPFQKVVTSPDSPHLGYETKGRTLSELEFIADYGSEIYTGGSGYLKGLEGSKAKGKQLFSPRSTSLDDANASSSTSSITTRSPPLSRTNTLPANYSLSRSFSVCSQYSSEITPRRRKKLTLFGRQNSQQLSSSVSSMQSLSVSDAKVPSPERFTSMYHAVRKGISEHISVNTAELNVLEMRQKEPGSFNAAQSYDADKQIKTLERMIKRLQYQQTQIDELHEAYALQQRYREGAYKLKSALSSSRVSSRSSLAGIKHDLSRCTETLCTLEQEFRALLGRFHFDMKGLMGFARLRAGDHFEVSVRYGAQKWKLRGSVKSSGDQSWDKTQHTMQPLLNDLIDVKVVEVKTLGKHVIVGTVSSETKDLFKVESQNLLMDINDTGTIKLSMTVSWSPFDGYESPATGHVSNTAASALMAPGSGSRFRSMSVVDRSSPGQARQRNRLSSAFARPLSTINSPSANANNSNNREYLEIEQPPPPANHISINSTKPTHLRGGLSEEEAFLQAISKPAVANGLPPATASDKHQITASEAEVFEEPSESQTAPARPSKPLSARERRARRRLAAKATQLNLAMDDYRGRYPDLRELEDDLDALMSQLKLPKHNIMTSDGFTVSDDVFTASDEDDEIPVFVTSDSNATSHAEFTSTSGKLICDEALVPHLSLVQMLLKDVGVFGPLRVCELLALDKLKKQGKILRRILEISKQPQNPALEDLKEFSGRRGFLEMWRSCVDGGVSFCVTGRTLRLELCSEYSRQVRDKHPDVVDKVFPELIRRIMWSPASGDVEKDDVTLFQMGAFVSDSLESERGYDFGKIVDKIAHELFITSTLSCGVRELILVAIQRMSSLLALRLSNLRALSLLLLDADAGIRTAAAAHIRHIATDKALREKAVVSYAELLESGLKRDRQCACIAVGFLTALECVPQLAYLFHSDPEAEVREAASNVLLSLGDEGRLAREEASSTWQVQTMTQQVTSRNRPRMGTAL